MCLDQTSGHHFTIQCHNDAMPQWQKQTSLVLAVVFFFLPRFKTMLNTFMSVSSRRRVCCPLCFGPAVFCTLDLLSFVLWTCCPLYFGPAVLCTLDLLSFVLWTCRPLYFGPVVLCTLDLLSFVLWTCCPLYFGPAVLWTSGDRCQCPYAGPSVWNNLPQTLRHSDSTSSFKAALKTHLFNNYF